MFVKLGPTQAPAGLETHIATHPTEIVVKSQQGQLQ